MQNYHPHLALTSDVHPYFYYIHLNMINIFFILFYQVTSDDNCQAQPTPSSAWLSSYFFTKPPTLTLGRDDFRKKFQIFLGKNISPWVTELWRKTWKLGLKNEFSPWHTFEICSEIILLTKFFVVYWKSTSFLIPNLMFFKLKSLSDWIVSIYYNWI